MARALWKGSISFGLVNIPIELHTAEPRQAEVVDLMERLRRSLDQSGAKSRAAQTRATKKAAAKKRTRRPA